MFLFPGTMTIIIRRQTLFAICFVISLTLYTVWIEQVERDLYGVKPGVTVEGIDLSYYLPKEVEVILQELALKHRQMPVNPIFDKQTGELLPERNGYEVDIDISLKSIFAAGPGQRVPLAFKVIRPKYTTKDLEGVDHQLGYFHTWLYGSSGRWQNIKLACKGCDNTIIWPGQVFSFNEVVGPRTPERGYEIAPIIGGVDTGGGVCQVATTLYNAALKAGLPIVERHPHSRPVPYVAPGKDATVSYNYADLKFKNDRPYPVIVKAGVGGGKVYAYILGKRG
ncbi:MAG: VanW family protein [Syntrophothermus sp.]|uniref:VanW family protein n=1 Tax=Syntrophothermus sp. TaxID=2736299 RepID=UPI00257CF55C|nr:VanW family protein [Syntrophothermus sp.]NSW83660.1 VanW family protein [Syntrophothermus sp.]